MADLPHSPDELLERLFVIFPQFRTAYEGPLYDEPPGYDSVLSAFTSDFGAQFPSCPVDQLRDFAALVNDAVAAGGELENAFSMCFLEHARQIYLDKPLWPYLSSAARERTKPY